MRNRCLLSILLAASALLSAPAAAQTTVVEQKIVSSESARRIVDACVAFAEARQATVAIAVVDPAGVLLEFHAMQGASEVGGTTAQLKARTAARWRRSTADVNQRLLAGVNRAPEWIGDFPQPGALPILVDGQIVGAVGVGGGQMDEPCARAGIEAVFGPNSAPPPVTPAAQP